MSAQHASNPLSRPLRLLPLLMLLAMSGCTGITIQATPPAASRSVTPTASNTAAARTSAAPGAAEGLRLARVLRDQGRYEGAASVYGQLEQRGELKPLELLEYATVASRVQSPEESLALFGRARQALRQAGTNLPKSGQIALCNGMGRARLALGQHDAARADFDCVLALDPDNLTAMNGKAVLLDAEGEHRAAQALLMRALDVAPADARSLNNLALSHIVAGELSKGRVLLAQADRPEWPALRLNLAFAYALEGDDARARQTLLRLMDTRQADRAMATFEQSRNRIRTGGSIAAELLAASRHLLPLTAPGDALSRKDDHG